MTASKPFSSREGNDTPLQCSCLENPRDGGPWWAAVYGVAQSRTQLKRLSSSSSSSSKPFSSDGKASACKAGDVGSIPGSDPWVGKIPWRRKWQPTPVFLPGEPHGQRSLGGYSPQGRKELDTTEQLHSLTHSFTRNKVIVSSIHGSPLQNLFNVHLYLFYLVDTFITLSMSSLCRPVFVSHHNPREAGTATNCYR